MRDTINIKTKYKKRERYPATFKELPLTGVLPRRDSKIRGAIMRMAKTNVILKGPVNKFFPRGQKLRWEAAVIGKLKRKYEC